MSINFTPHPSSWRDPSGFVFEKQQEVFRQVNQVYREDFDLFQATLYDELVNSGKLIPHTIISENLTGHAEWYLTIKPEKIPFISFPYEWSFDMLRDAALLTLSINRVAMSKGMILKDATPYNVQWYKGRMIFIDSLSFEKYDASQPWIAYRQFCESFLAPLLLAHYSGNECSRLLLAYPNGIPLELASKLLPRSTRFSLHVYLHMHLHASISQKKKQDNFKKIHFTRAKLERLITSLEILIKKLKTPARSTNWTSYYEEASQRNEYLEEKSRILKEYSDLVSPKTVVDLGANKGEFAKLFADQKIHTIASDADAYCVNSMYLEKKEFLQPVLLDLTTPTPSIGVNNEERASFTRRVNADLVLALALIHHLSIGNNIPFEKAADFFHSAGKALIIEFVPKTDEKIAVMLTGKKDIYSWYTQDEFESAFTKFYRIEKKQNIASSGRTLYLMTHEG